MIARIDTDASRIELVDVVVDELAEPGPAAGPERPQVHRVDRVLGADDRVDRQRHDDRTQAPQPPDRPAAQLVGVVAADALRVDRRLEVIGERRDEAERQVDAERELGRDPEARERRAQVVGGDAVGDREADRRERQEPDHLGRAVRDRLGRDGRADDRDVEQNVEIALDQIPDFALGDDRVEEDEDRRGRRGRRSTGCGPGRTGSRPPGSRPGRSAASGSAIRMSQTWGTVTAVRIATRMSTRGSRRASHDPRPR